MALGLDVAVGVAVAAPAGVGGVALLGAGGLRHHAGVLMLGVDDLEGRAAGEDVAAAVLVGNGDGGGADLHIIGDGDGVLALVDDRVAHLDGDGGNLFGAVVLKALGVHGDGGFHCLGCDGKGCGSGAGGAQGAVFQGDGDGVGADLGGSSFTAVILAGVQNSVLSRVIGSALDHGSLCAFAVSPALDGNFRLALALVHGQGSGGVAAGVPALRIGGQGDGDGAGFGEGQDAAVQGAGGDLIVGGARVLVDLEQLRYIVGAAVVCDGVGLAGVHNRLSIGVGDLHGAGGLDALGNIVAGGIHSPGEGVHSLGLGGIALHSPGDGQGSDAVLGYHSRGLGQLMDRRGALGVVALGPVVAGAGLAEDEVVRPEELAERAGAHRVHGARLQVHQDRARDVAPAGGLVVVHVDALDLELRVPAELTARVDAVLVGHHLPELGADLVAALACLDVDDLSHAKLRWGVEFRIRLNLICIRSIIYCHPLRKPEFAEFPRSILT